ARASNRASCRTRRMVRVLFIVLVLPTLLLVLDLDESRHPPAEVFRHFVKLDENGEVNAHALFCLRRDADDPARHLDIPQSVEADESGVAKLQPRNVDLAEVGRLDRSEEHTSELQSRENLVCRLLLEK